MRRYTVTIQWPGFSTETLYFYDLETAYARAATFGFTIIAIHGKTAH